MTRKLIFLFSLISILGCKNNKERELEIENKYLKKEIELAKLKDSINNAQDSKLTIKKDTVINKVSKDNNIITLRTSNLDYIKEYKNKYPYELKLFEKGELKNRLVKLLGNKNYKKFLQYFDVQTPIEIINDDYTFLNAAAAHSFGMYESAILIDFNKNQITVGILDDTKVLFFSENKEYSLKNVRNNTFSKWIFEAEINAKENKSL